METSGLELIGIFASVVSQSRGHWGRFLCFRADFSPCKRLLFCLLLVLSCVAAAKMGFFGKRENASEDAIDYAPDTAESKKQSPPEQVEQSVQTPVPLVEVDPAVEKRLLRKLDLRLPTLMMFLCECCVCVWRLRMIEV